MKTAKGCSDVPPQEKVIKNKVIDTLRNVFELYGFRPLETPVIERYETLASKFAAGEDSDALKETFKLTDQGKRELGLRFDLTVPLCRFVAMNPTLKLPFKRYEIGPVFRDGPIKVGRTRQFWQCDVDTIGTSNMLADAEILAVAETAFNQLGLDVVIKVNNRKLLNGILSQCNIRKKEEAIIAIDKLDKIGQKGVTDELKQRGYSSTQIKTVFSLIEKGISLKQLAGKVTNDEALEGIQELQELFKYLKQLGLRRVKFDVSLARGLGYYTGTVFEAFLKKGKITSSVAAGGRYDNIIGNFMGGNRVVPAIGVSFGMVPIVETLKDGTETAAAKVFVIPINTMKESLQITQELRKAGISTDFALGKKGVSKNLGYANSLGISYALILGDDEVKKKKVLLRNMETGNEQLLSLKNAIAKLK
jgi:histidyl-tRNA synthetase